MKKLLIIYFLLLALSSFSQTFKLSDYSQSSYTTNFIQKKGANSFYVEVPPWVVKGGWYQYFFSTQYTASWSSLWSMGALLNESKVVGNSSDYGPVFVLAASNWWNKFYDPGYLNSTSYAYKEQWQTYHWRRNYNGIFSAHVVTLPNTNQQLLFAVSHGENKNDKQNNYFYQNTVRSSFLINQNDPNTFSGFSNGIYKDCWESYFGFLNGNWSIYDAAHNWGNQYLNDLGPLAWPSAGYINTNNTQASSGLRHPSSIVFGNYIYIYVSDESKDGTGGIKLIRSTLNNIRNPAFYETWSEIKGWIPSLPVGFSKELCSNFFAIRGPSNTPVFPNDRNTVRFTVAKFKNTNQFIGVEQYNDDYDNNRAKLAFRFSSDLIHWTNRTIFFSNSSLNWSNLPLKYPIFLSADGTSNTDIDQNQFYVIGSSNDNSITKLFFNKTSGRINRNIVLKPSIKEIMCDLGTLEKIDNSIFVKVYPNTQKKMIDLEIRINEDAPCKMNIYNTIGALMQTSDIQLKQNSSFQFHIPFSSEIRGIYYIIIFNKNKIIGRSSFIN